MLKSILSDWTDFDGAEWAIAVSLGLMSETEPAWKSVKGVFWTDNPVSRMLHAVLKALVEAGVLETNADEQFRYNRSFTPPWDRSATINGD